MADLDPPALANLGKTAPGPAPALVSGGDLPAGYVVGEYRVERVIGRGGMGVVYSGVQPLIEKRVAIKVLSSDLSADPALVRRFVDEARAVNRIRHPNIVDIFSFGQLADSRQYFVMEFLEGRTLADRLTARDLPLLELPPLLAQMCDALDAAHGESIVHRDLKPENIWIVEPRRGRPFVKLLDFGIAKLMATDGQSTTQTGMLVGTPQYMSPEQCHGKAVDQRTDIYAMGVILYQIYTGRAPFQGETFAEILTKQLAELPERPATLSSLPPGLDDLIMRCLAKDAATRPQSARELGEALARVLASPRTVLEPPPAATVRSTTTLRGSARSAEAAAQPTGSSRRRWLTVGLVALGAAGLGAVLVTRLQGRSVAPSKASMAASAAQTAGDEPFAGAGVPSPDALPANLLALPTPTPAAAEQPHAKPADTATSVGPSPGKRSARSSNPRTRAAASGLVTDNPFR